MAVWSRKGCYSKLEALSVPIIKGVRFRFGSGSIKAAKVFQATAHGRLLITDKAICFESPEKNERITWGQVSNIELLFDGFIISKRTGPPRIYQVASPDPEFAALVEVSLIRTS